MLSLTVLDLLAWRSSSILRSALKFFRSHPAFGRPWSLASRLAGTARVFWRFFLLVSLGDGLVSVDIG